MDKGVHTDDNEPKATKYILRRWMVAPMADHKWGLAQCTKGLFKYYWLYRYYDFSSKEEAIAALRHMQQKGEVLWP